MNSDREATIDWRCRDRVLTLGARTIVMGILNVTPDSFSDGGRCLDLASARARAIQMAEEGADIIDIGGESSRPGSAPVSVEEEIRRVVPVVEALRGATDCILSVDTRKAEVAERALEKGAHVINDISAMTHDERMPDIAKQSKAGVILMHMKGEPATMQQNPRYDDVVEEVAQWLEARLRDLSSRGIDPSSMALDPGIGFGKTMDHNMMLLRGLARLGRTGRAIVVGVSRKRFLGAITGREVGDRAAASLGAAAYAIMRGAHIIRVHDVKESCDVARVVDMLKSEEPRNGPA
jgi:dihydropteroate synthase